MCAQIYKLTKWLWRFTKQREERQHKKIWLYSLRLLLLTHLNLTLYCTGLKTARKIKREIRQRKKKTGQGQSGELWEDRLYHIVFNSTITYSQCASIAKRKRGRGERYERRNVYCGSRFNGKESPTFSAPNLVNWMRKHTTKVTHTQGRRSF